MTLREKIAEKLGCLREYVGYLRDCQKHSVSDLKQDPILRGGSRKVFAAFSGVRNRCG